MSQGQKDKLPNGLTPIEEKFAHEALKTNSWSEAYRQANPRSASWKSKSVVRYASAMWHSEQVQKRMEELRLLLEEEGIANAARVLAIATINAEADVGDLFDAEGNLIAPKDLPERVRLAVASVKVARTITRTDENVTITDQVIEVKLNPKLQALDQLHRYHGNYAKDNATKPAPTVTINVSTPAIDYEEIRRRTQEIRAKAGIPPAIH